MNHVDSWGGKQLRTRLVSVLSTRRVGDVPRQREARKHGETLCSLGKENDACLTSLGKKSDPITCLSLMGRMGEQVHTGNSEAMR